MESIKRGISAGEFSLFKTELTCLRERYNQEEVC